MLYLIRRLLRFFKKEEKLLENYSHSHPYFLFYLLLDLLIITFIATLIALFAMSNNPTTLDKALIDKDAAVFDTSPLFAHIASSASEMAPVGLLNITKSVKESKRPVYWVGNSESNLYTIKYNCPDVSTIIYYVDKPSTGGLTPKMMVQTFDDRNSFLIHDGSLETNSSLTNATVSDSNKVVEYDNVKMNWAAVVSPDNSQVVLLSYNTPQDTSTLISNAMKVSRLS